MPSSYPSPGDHIGRFRVLAQLGQGGMGVVYDALEENLDRRVALKVISPQFADDSDFRERFSREARALASLDSPNVVQVYAHGEEDGYLYIATQLIPDGDLGQMITKWGPAPVGKAVELIVQVASGLADAHAAGLVHRDIKPANVLVRRRGSGASVTVAAYLGDFGIARRVDAEATRVGSAIIGTPSYMAPELHGGAQASTASDLYSLGCVLWVTLTGRPPYPGVSEFEIIGGHITKPVPQLAGAGSPLLDAVNRILRLTMGKTPADRYPTSTALRDELRRAALLTQDPYFHRMGSSETSASSDATALAAPGSFPSPAPSTPPTPSGPVAGAHRGGASYPGTTPPARAQVPVPRPLSSPVGGLAANSMGGPGIGYAPTYGGYPSGAPSGQRSRKGLWIGLSVAALVAVTGGVAAALLTGGGFADMPPEEIITAAEKDMLVLDSVHLDGDVVSDGQKLGFDITITARGDCDGSITAGDGRALLRGVGGKTYLKADEAFWKVSLEDTARGTQVYGVVGDNWVPVDAESATDFNTFCDLNKLLESDGTKDKSAVTKGTSTIAGQKVVEIETTDSDDMVTTAYVSIDEPHYLIKLESGSDESSFTFSDFDAPFSVEAPPADQIVDPDALTG